MYVCMYVYSLSPRILIERDDVTAYVALNAVSTNRTVFQRHDARRVTAYAFALNQDDGGSFRRDIRDSFPAGKFVDVFGKSDQEVATVINRQRIQVLIDIDYNKLRLSILALAPATVQQFAYNLVNPKP